MLKDYQKRLKDILARAKELDVELAELINELEDKSRELEIRLDDARIIFGEENESIRSDIFYISDMIDTANGTFEIDKEPYEELEERWGKVE